MKKIPLFLVVLSLLLASYDIVKKTVTKFKVYCVGYSNQPSASDADNPEWYELNSETFLENSTEYTSSQMDALTVTNCNPGYPICLVQVRLVDGLAVEIKIIRNGYCIRP